MKFSKTLVFGFIGGVLITLSLSVLAQVSKKGFSGEETVAEMGGEKLTKADLRKTVSNELIPIENDEYLVLSRGVEEWLNTRLLQQEAKAQGLTSEELYKKEIWSKVQVSYSDLQEYYNKTKELYNEPFEKVSPLIMQELRRSEYARVKKEYLDGLKKKYSAKIHLQKPKTFVEGLALPSPLPSSPSAGVAAAVQGIVPQGAGGPVNPKSEIGKFPSKGPENAPITIAEFSDFHCPFCKKVEPTIDQLMKNYPDKVRVVWRHYPLPFHTGADRTHEASMCAQEQGKFWQFHSEIYALPAQPQEGDLDKIAQKIGLDAGKFQECVKSRRHQNAVKADITEGQSKGVRGTPSFLINNQLFVGAQPYESFAKAVQDILDGKAIAGPPTPAAAPSPAAPQAPPQVVTFDDLDGKPSKGPKKAPVTVVQFSDFHCPFCEKVEPTIDQLMKNYPDKVRVVWRHYPLPFHTGADRTHEASECANEQGKFWEFHNKVFAAPAAPQGDATLQAIAKEAGLNEGKFEKCMGSGKYKEVIQKDIAKGSQVGVRGTPATFINGKLVSGAQPYENFDQIVKSELAKS